MPPIPLELPYLIPRRRNICPLTIDSRCHKATSYTAFSGFYYASGRLYQHRPSMLLFIRYPTEVLKPVLRKTQLAKLCQRPCRLQDLRQKSGIVPSQCLGCHGGKTGLGFSPRPAWSGHVLVARSATVHAEVVCKPRKAQAWSGLMRWGDTRTYRLEVHVEYHEAVVLVFVAVALPSPAYVDAYWCRGP